MGRLDVALEEYKQLRAEILVHSQAQTTIVGIALTATAAIAGVAFGSGAIDNPERLEILLALPLILTGLGLSHLARSVNIIAIGQYIGLRLWPALAATQPGDTTSASDATVIHSWEQSVASGRGLSQAAKGIKGWLSVVPGLFVFGFPSLAALTINYKLAWLPVITETHPSGLQLAWLLDSLALVAAACMLVAAGRYGSPQTPTTNQSDDEAEGPSATLKITADLGDQFATGTAVLRRAPEREP